MVAMPLLLVVLILALCVLFPASRRPDGNTAALPARDVRRHDGQVVVVEGRVGERVRVDRLCAVTLVTDGVSGHFWYAVVAEDRWLALTPGEPVRLRGVLRTHEVGGVRHAVVWGAS